MYNTGTTQHIGKTIWWDAKSKNNVTADSVVSAWTGMSDPLSISKIEFKHLIYV